MENGLEALEEYLKTKRLRLTAERRRVAEGLLAARKHVGADELIEFLRKRGTPVSKATVYRTLALMEKCGGFDAHDFGQGRKVYEPMAGRSHHDHLYCISCGTVIEFSEERIERLQDRVVKKYRFTPVYHSHKIFGYCRRCGPSPRRSGRGYGRAGGKKK